MVPQADKVGTCISFICCISVAHHLVWAGTPALVSSPRRVSAAFEAIRRSGERPFLFEDPAEMAGATKVLPGAQGYPFCRYETGRWGSTAAGVQDLIL